LKKVLHLGNQKLTGVFPRTLDDDLISGPLELVRCVADGELCCSLLQLRHSYPKAAIYGEDYGYQPDINFLMVRHLKLNTKRLLNLVNPSEGSLLVDQCKNSTELFLLTASNFVNL